jgi:hypothetical protein
MGEIEKRHDLKTRKLDIEKKIFSSIEKSCMVLFKTSPFRIKNFQINELVRYETFFQQSVFEMSHFDIV